MFRCYLVLLVCLLPSFLSSVGQKHPASTPPPPINQADYTLTVHVISSYWLQNGPSPVQVLKAVVDGRHVELQAPAAGVLALGLYKARRFPTPASPKTGAYDNFITYSFLLDDGTTRNFHLTGYELEPSMGNHSIP